MTVRICDCARFPLLVIILFVASEYLPIWCIWVGIIFGVEQKHFCGCFARNCDITSVTYFSRANCGSVPVAP